MVTLLDQRRIVGLQAVAQKRREHGIGSLGARMRPALADSMAASNLLLHLGIGCKFVVGDEVLVVGEELRLQNVEPVEFGEQVGGRIGGRTQGIVGMRALPLLERLVGLGELQVIHCRVAVIEQAGGCGEACRRRPVRK